MIKLALSDLDNTLLPFGRERISKRTIRAIHACQQHGVAVGPASGRDLSAMVNFFEGDTCCYHTGVLVNGQRVYSKGSLIFEKNLDASALQRGAEVVSAHPGCAFIIYRPDGVGDWVGEPRENLGYMYELEFVSGGRRHESLPTYPVAKAGIICMGDAEALYALKEELGEACPEFVFPNTTEHWLDISPRNWTKVDGIKVLMEKMGVRLDEVCVFGDADNDLAMLDYLPNSCAVANANENAKAAARWHIGASADDGVAIALEQIAHAAQQNLELGREDIMPAFMQP